MSSFYKGALSKFQPGASCSLNRPLAVLSIWPETYWESVAQPGILFGRGQSPNVHWTALFVYFRTVKIDIKHWRKILARWFQGGPWPLRPHSGCATVGSTWYFGNARLSAIHLEGPVFENITGNNEQSPLIAINVFFSIKHVAFRLQSFSLRFVLPYSRQGYSFNRLLNNFSLMWLIVLYG